MSATGQTAAPAHAFAGRVASVVRVILGLLLLGMVALNVTSAMCRYIFGIVFVGADELLVFTMIWMVMVGMILATANRNHIALDFLVTRASPRRRVALSILHHAVLTFACGYAAFYCWSFVTRVAAIGQTSMALGIPMAIPHAALFVGFAGTAIAAALLLASDIAEFAHGPRAAAS
jgi:TRAP-type C4-dicarboxylate transport system permease small subunit